LIYHSENLETSRQGPTGTENRPGQFSTTTLTAQPNFHSTGPTLAK